MNIKRKRKIEEEIKKIVGNAILYEMKDPRIPVVTTVTGADLSGDMKQVKIYISTIGDANEETVEILNKASGFFRSLIGKEMTTYNTPKPIFIYDDSIEKGMEMDKLLEDLVSDEKDD